MAMEEASYDSENLLQELLAKHPDLLAGEQINSEEPRRWLLITREMSVPDKQDGSARWSLDHLFLDQDAVPTLVEVKRSSDTRIRREVIGQMLDYAANAVAYWPVEQIKAKFESRCEKNDDDPDEVLVTFLREDHETDEYWVQVKTNLQAGRIRMVFLADSIPSELRHAVEFLNDQMDPAEVLAIELKQFVGEGMKTLVPRVLGQTERAKQKKATGRSKRENVTESEYMAEIATDLTKEEVDVAKHLIEWAKTHGARCDFSTGKKGANFIPILKFSDRQVYPISVQQIGRIAIQMRWLKEHPPFDNATKRDELFRRIENIPRLIITEAGMEGFPKIPIASLADKKQLQCFVDTLDWIVNEFGSTSMKM